MMTTQTLEISWLDGQETLSLSELARVSSLNTDELNELVDYGALIPLVFVQAGQPQRHFSAAFAMPLREASRLRMDYDLDLFTVAILLGYLCRIESLEQQLRSASVA